MAVPVDNHRKKWYTEIMNIHELETLLAPEILSIEEPVKKVGTQTTLRFLKAGDMFAFPDSAGYHRVRELIEDKGYPEGMRIRSVVETCLGRTWVGNYHLDVQVFKVEEK
jgi:hypothetical protein